MCCASCSILASCGGDSNRNGNCASKVDSLGFFFTEGDFESVIQYSQNVSSCDSLYLEKILSFRAQSYFELGNFEKSIECFSELFSLGLGNALDYEMRGRAYDEVNEDDSALADYKSALRLDSTLSRSRFNSAEILRIQQKYDEALAELNHLPALGFKNSALYSEYGLIYSDMGRLDEAIDSYEYGLSLDTTDYLAYNYSITLYNKENYKRSLQLMDAAIRRSPRTAWYYYNRAYIKLKLDDRIGACEDLEIAGDLGLDVSVDQKNECSS